MTDLKVFNKFDGSEVGEVDIIKLESSTYGNDKKKIGSMDIEERLSILERASELLKMNRDLLATTLSLETGKAFKNAIREINRAESGFRNPTLAIYKENGLCHHNSGNDSYLHMWNIPEGIPVQTFADQVLRDALMGNRSIVFHNPACPLTTMKISELIGESVEEWRFMVADVLTESQNKAMKNAVISGDADQITFSGTPDQCLEFSKGSGLVDTHFKVMGNARAIIWDKKYMEYALDWAIDHSLKTVSNHRMRVQTLIVKAEFFAYFKNRFVELSRKLNFGNPVIQEQDLNYYPGKIEEQRAIEFVKALRQGGFILEAEELKRFPLVLYNEYPDLSSGLNEIDGAITAIVPAKSLKEAVEYSFHGKPWETTYLFTNGLEEIDFVKFRKRRGTFIINPDRTSELGVPEEIRKIL
ncbi:MAG: aldehyde dehydrogenase family protein [Thermoplasmataceae archaeon]